MARLKSLGHKQSDVCEIALMQLLYFSGQVHVHAYIGKLNFSLAERIILSDKLHVA
jgi:hypothetical protein